MKKILSLIALSTFALSISGNVAAETKKERWIKEQDAKVEREAKAKKENAMDRNSNNAWRGGGKKQQDAEKKIDQETAEKKRQTREAAARLGPKGDEKYDAKKDKRKNRPNVD